MESKFSFIESEFEVPTFPWKVENEENPRTLQGHKVIDLGAIRKGIVIGVSTPNMKSLSIVFQKLLLRINDRRLDGQTGQIIVCPDPSIRIGV